jgi:hypothetical protein
MLFSPWRRLRSSDPGTSQGRQRGRPQSAFSRPQLEPLEDRLLPALVPTLIPALPAVGLASGPSALLRVVPPATPGAVLNPQQPSGLLPAPPNPMTVTLDENSAASVVKLGAILAARRDIHPKDGLQLSILGNTNSGLVATDLSGSDVTLTCARGKIGTAIITVGATDADGVSVREIILVTVRPLKAN